MNGILAFDRTILAWKGAVESTISCKEDYPHQVCSGSSMIIILPFSFLVLSKISAPEVDDLHHISAAKRKLYLEMLY